MRNILLPILLSLCSSAQADVVGLHLVSYHSDEAYTKTYPRPYRECEVRAEATICSSGLRPFHEDVKYNNFNPGIYWRDDSGLTLGGYWNSYRKPTAYVGWTWETPRWHDLSAAATVALATGYKGRAGAGVLRPMILPSIAWDATKTVTTRLGFGPSQGGAIFHLTLEYRL